MRVYAGRAGRSAFTCSLPSRMCSQGTSTRETSTPKRLREKVPSPFIVFWLPASTKKVIAATDRSADGRHLREVACGGLRV